MTNSLVAVKKIASPFDTPALAKRTYREVHLLSNLRHDNVCVPMARTEHWEPGLI